LGFLRSESQALPAGDTNYLRDAKQFILAHPAVLFAHAASQRREYT